MSSHFLFCVLPASGAAGRVEGFVWLGSTDEPRTTGTLSMQSSSPSTRSCSSCSASFFASVVGFNLLFDTLSFVEVPTVFEELFEASTGLSLLDPLRSRFLFLFCSTVGRGSKLIAGLFTLVKSDVCGAGNVVGDHVVI